jgi:hypothetical protein
MAKPSLWQSVIEVASNVVMVIRGRGGTIMLKDEVNSVFFQLRV